MSEPGQHTGWSTAVTTANPPNALSNGIDLCLGLVAAGHLHQFHIPIHLLQAAAATTVRHDVGGTQTDPKRALTLSSVTGTFRPPGTSSTTVLSDSMVLNVSSGSSSWLTPLLKPSSNCAVT